jgi:hypothetical protein
MAAAIGAVAGTDPTHLFSPIAAARSAPTIDFL